MVFCLIMLRLGFEMGWVGVVFGAVRIPLFVLSFFFSL